MAPIHPLNNMNKGVLMFLFFLTGMILISCNHREKLGGNEYLTWFSSAESPAVEKIDGESYHYTAKHTPTDYILSVEAFNGVAADRKKREDQLKDQLFFQFQVQLKKDSTLTGREALNDEKFEELKKYIRMEAQGDFKLRANSEELTPMIYHMERSVIYNTITVVMGFGVKEGVEEFTLEFKNRLSGDELDFEFDLDDFPILDHY